MESRASKYSDVIQTPVVGMNYEVEYERVCARMKEMELQHEEELNRNDSEWMRKIAELDERRVRELNEVKKELNYNRNIVKSVLHIRED